MDLRTQPLESILHNLLDKDKKERSFKLRRQMKMFRHSPQLFSCAVTLSALKIPSLEKATFPAVILSHIAIV
jgi:hypothetical protein